MRFLILPLLLVGCAAPGSSTKIPQPVAIALAGGDVAELPPEAWNGPPVELAMYWYDRQWGIQVSSRGRIRNRIGRSPHPKRAHRWPRRCPACRGRTHP